MIRKKEIILILLFLIISTVSLNAQEENIDVIVVIDTSWSVWEYYDDIVNYLIRYLLEELLHQYDTFHLLYFSEKIDAIDSSYDRIICHLALCHLENPWNALEEFKLIINKGGM